MNEPDSHHDGVGRGHSARGPAWSADSDEIASAADGIGDVKERLVGKWRQWHPRTPDACPLWPQLREAM